MDDYQIVCDECGDSFSGLVRVDEYLAHAHTMEFERTGVFCPTCARIVQGRRTWGQPEGWAVEAATEMMGLHYGDPVEVTWLQGDEHRWAFLVRRAAVP